MNFTNYSLFIWMLVGSLINIQIGFSQPQPLKTSPTASAVTDSTSIMVTDADGGTDSVVIQMERDDSDIDPNSTKRNIINAFKLGAFTLAVVGTTLLGTNYFKNKACFQPLPSHAPAAAAALHPGHSVYSVTNGPVLLPLNGDTRINAPTTTTRALPVSTLSNPPLTTTQSIHVQKTQPLIKASEFGELIQEELSSYLSVLNGVKSERSACIQEVSWFKKVTGNIFPALDGCVADQLSKLSFNSIEIKDKNPVKIIEEIKIYQEISTSNDPLKDRSACTQDVSFLKGPYSDNTYRSANSCVLSALLAKGFKKVEKLDAGDSFIPRHPAVMKSANKFE
jgi:hypothetical protein